MLNAELAICNKDSTRKLKYFAWSPYYYNVVNTRIYHTRVYFSSNVSNEMLSSLSLLIIFHETKSYYSRGESAHSRSVRSKEQWSRGWDGRQMRMHKRDFLVATL